MFRVKKYLRKQGESRLFRFHSACSETFGLCRAVPGPDSEIEQKQAQPAGVGRVHAFL
jgi:hypothetical protein